MRGKNKNNIYYILYNIPEKKVYKINKLWIKLVNY